MIFGQFIDGLQPGCPKKPLTFAIPRIKLGSNSSGDECPGRKRVRGHYYFPARTGRVTLDLLALYSYVLLHSVRGSRANPDRWLGVAF